MALVTIFYRVATTMFDDTNVCYLVMSVHRSTSTPK